MSTRLESQRRIDTEYALRCVHLAYARLKACGAIHAAARVRASLKSVEGAVRHARGLENRDQPPHHCVRRHRLQSLTPLPGATKLIKLIQMELSGKVWDAGTLARVASMLRAHGIRVEEPR